MLCTDQDAMDHAEFRTVTVSCRVAHVPTRRILPVEEGSEASGTCGIGSGTATSL
jgi:hypothetical protein